MIIVTGGAGFIGSALIAGLNTRGINDIIVVDQLGTDQKWKNLRNLRYADYYEKDDFLQMVIQNQLPSQVKTVFHLGANSSTTETDASFLVKNNYEYTKILCQWAINSDVRFIYASSASTYGNGELGFSDNEDEIHNLQPLNMYGYSKQMFDQWAKKAELFNSIVGLKYFNVFGPNEYHKGSMRSFVLKAFEQIRDTGKVKLFKSHKPEYKDGEQLRDFIYIKDVVDMTLFFYENPEVSGLFNIGTGKARNWNDLVSAVFTALGKKAKIEYIDMPESIRDQYQYYTQAEMEKLKKTGWGKSTHTLEAAVTDYVKNYLAPHCYLAPE